ncbi:protein SPT2 homolog [Copidosoma floridanum]|uniref:protein SPT2 homolog n=1 Tax=Copidosoma floridanum TaxID=29053 RepID=UPI0006C94CF2|nr:protein SPT2 homolog [Copidosoma floridanum]
MDFGKLLTIAQQNSNYKPKASCEAKLTPPKKESKKSKQLSDNIKKFLAKREEEDRLKALEEKKKKEDFLALRDQKAHNRISKHLKVCKAANKSVIADAIDNENTAITIAGPAQCDEDDYGYVSQEASALYDKLMNKYNSLPPEKPLFSNDGKKIVKDIASTKDRVKQALKQQAIEESQPHRRKRRHKNSESGGKIKDENESEDREGDKETEKDRDREREREPEKEEKPRPKKRPMPPPLEFTELLKIAEKVKNEPIKIEPKLKPNPDAERLMTKKQMQEYAKEKEWRERKEQRRLEGQKSAHTSNDSGSCKPSSFVKSVVKPSSSKTAGDVLEKTAIKSLPPIAKKPSDRPADRSSSTNKPIEKSNSMQRSTEKSSSMYKPTEKSNSSYKPIDKNNGSYKPTEKTNGSYKPTEKSNTSYKPTNRSNDVSRSADRSKVLEKSSNSSRTAEKSNTITKSAPKVSEKDEIAEERRKLQEEKLKLEEIRRSIEEEKKKLQKIKKVENSRPNSSASQKSASGHNSSKLKESVKPSSSLSKSGPSKQVSSSAVKTRPFSPADVRPRQFPPADVKPRQFPPPDVRPLKPKSSKLKVNKRRIYDDEDDYDSELDDFIDDGPIDEHEDYSKYISEIFGYDKSKYRDFDDDDAVMESNFAQQLKEEFVSTKQGILEDLEDMRKESMEKKRKKQLLEQLKKKRKS